MWKKIIQAIAALLLIIMGKVMLQGDYIPFLQWWTAVFCIGIVFLPFTSMVFTNFNDKGYLFSKTIGIAVTGYLMWLLSSLHLLKFSTASCLVSLTICLVLNLLLCLLLKRYHKGSANETSFFPEIVRKDVVSFYITEEILFFGVFLLFTYIRAFKPEAYGTEKFMDYGFMTSMMRSETMPPQDFWFSGTNLNYYYVGQFFATFLTRISFVKVAHGYNLMLTMIGAFAFVLPFSLVYHLSYHYQSEIGKRKRFLPTVAGLLAGAGVCLAGNMHYPTYQWFEPYVRKFFGMEENMERYWFPDATRFIGYHPDTPDKTIHEFPSYSIVLGDLHAHVINILFVLTVLGILLSWLYSRKAIKEKIPTLRRELLHPNILLIGFFIGLFHATNFWDYPIYYVVSGAIILFSNMVVYNFKGKAFYLTALQGILIIILSKIIILPFTLNFDKMSSSIRLAVNHTPLNQLIILWGLPIFMVISFLCFLISGYLRMRTVDRIPDSEQKKAVVFQFIEYLTPSDLFIITIGLCAIGLVLIPEVIYIEDIYSGEYKRANTMFKLTYQAFIMFGICLSYLFPRLLRFGETKRQKRAAFFGLLLFLLSLCYIQNAVNAWYGNIFNRSGYQGLDCTEFLETEMPDDYSAINWLNENITGMPVVLEANGDSYTDYQRVSVFTGLPTVLGWRTHEWLWKSDTDILDQRASDIETIYTSENEDELKSLIDEYHISYLYVGKLEHEKYENINHTLIKGLGEEVYHSAGISGYYDTYIIKVNHQTQ